jgi:hypothetical protein
MTARPRPSPPGDYEVIDVVVLDDDRIEWTCVDDEGEFRWTEPPPDPLDSIRTRLDDLLRLAREHQASSPAPSPAPLPPLRPGEVVSEDRAARELPFRRSDAVHWLRAEGLSVPADGRRVVSWSAVLERLNTHRDAPARSREGRPTAAVPGPKLLDVPGRTLG